MNTKFAWDLTLMGGAQILGLRWPVLTADPESPLEGMAWYRSDIQQFRMRKNGLTVNMSEGDLSQMVSRAVSAGADRLALSAGADRSIKDWDKGEGLVKVGPSGTVSVAVPDADFATMAYVNAQIDAGLQGLAWKDDCVTATSTPETLSGNWIGKVVSGVTLAANDRVLVRAQTSSYWDNGIYVVTAGTGLLVRAADMNLSKEFNSAIVPVTGGTQAGTQWRQVYANPVVGDAVTTAGWIAFTPFIPTVPDATETVKGVVVIESAYNLTYRAGLKPVPASGLQAYARTVSVAFTNATTQTILGHQDQPYHGYHGLFGAGKQEIHVVVYNGDEEVGVKVTVNSSGDVTWQSLVPLTGRVVITAR